MKLAHAIVSGTIILCAGHAGGAVTMPGTGATLTLSAPKVATGGVFASLPKTTASATDAAQPGVTHMLVGPMTIAPSGINAFAGTYSMVNASTGSTVSSGLVQFTMADGDAFVGYSNVVGVIPLSGGWTNSSITLTPQAGTLAGATATVAYNTAISVMSVTIGSSVSYLPYVATNEGELVFESPVWLTNGSTTVKFNGGYAVSQGNGTYTGILTPADGSAEYVVTLTDPNDSDADAVTDLTDADNYWYSGSIYYNGAEYSDWLGWFNFYYPPAKTGVWNNYSVDAHAYIWHYDHGLLYTCPQVKDGVTWMCTYDMELGWTATNADVYPQIYAYDVVLDGTDYGDAWLQYVKGGSTTNRFFYAVTGKMNSGSNMGSVNEGFRGWWSIPGANSTK